ncbi:hypothetical protein KY289_012236 [Solanum tuberosum]|nr:hypothetical protein KY289_012236 [Solanum tuberosum]KAH0709345.1 hypothetical protein KY284_010772 [Solanum tuberosum]
MARRDMIIFVTLIILLVCYPSSFEARRLLNKGTVIPSSSPSKKGVVHAGQQHEFGGVNVDQSVPSPGIGN